jgi:DNA-binding CsgD family transcriptional regulator
MIDFAESTVLRKLGDHDGADALLYRAKRLVEDGPYVLGTEELWPGLVRAAQRAGNNDEVLEHLARAAETARLLDTDRAHIAHLTVRAEVLGDRQAGERVVKLVQGRPDLPYENALALMRVGLCGIETRRLFGEAYDLFGQVGALFWRARMRKHMRDLKVPAPSRAETTTENERLLAVLVAEGLSNRQLSVVFGTSEKSVEGRLTRMFARIGYRSRVELAAAILTGEYVS